MSLIIYMTGTVYWSSSQGNCKCAGFLCKCTHKEGGLDIICSGCCLYS
jgi:hypothetical protein